MFVTNIATQPGETDKYTSSDHIHALEDLIGFELVDVIVCNSCYDGEFGKERFSGSASTKMKCAIRAFTSPTWLISDNLLHHDAAKLAQTLMDLYNERTGPLQQGKSNAISVEIH